MSLSSQGRPVSPSELEIIVDQIWCAWWWHQLNQMHFHYYFFFFAALFVLLTVTTRKCVASCCNWSQILRQTCTNPISRLASKVFKTRASESFNFSASSQRCCQAQSFVLKLVCVLQKLCLHSSRFDCEFIFQLLNLVLQFRAVSWFSAWSEPVLGILE